MQKQSNRIEQEIDELLAQTQSILISILIRLGPFFVALMPAMFTGYSVFEIFKEQYWVALLFALIVGFALEAVGILTTHTSVDLYNAWQGGYTTQGKFVLMVLMIPIYIASVDGIVLYSDVYAPTITGIALASPWLTSITYLAIALTADVRAARMQEKSRQAKAEHLEQAHLQAERERIRAELEQRRLDKQAEREHLLAMRKAEQEHEQKLKQLEVQPAQSGHTAKAEQNEFDCENPGCPQSFPTVQARNAHSRWCEFKPVPENGY